MKHLTVFLLAVWLFSSCGKDAADATEATTDTNPANTEIPSESGPVTLTSNIEFLRLRNSPGPTGEIVDNLPYGAEVTYLGEMSAFTTEVTLRGITFDEPWLKVRSSSGAEGWVFGGALNFNWSSSGLPAQLMEIRLKSLFGQELATSLSNYQKEFRQARSDQQLLDAYREGKLLQEQVNNLLESVIEVQDYDKLPDLFWLKQAMPAYQPQLVAEGTMYYLFNDFGKWKARAERTSGKADDSFFDLGISLFKMDSIEYFWADYFLQTWDYGGHSELGAGKHVALLNQMSQVFFDCPDCLSEIEAYKTDLVNDILGPEVSYWNNQQLILEELDQILETPPAILSENDKIALQQRRSQFESPEEHQIQLDQRDYPGE